MKPETEKLLVKASRAIAAAKLLLQAGDADFAAGARITRWSMLRRRCLPRKGVGSGGTVPFRLLTGMSSPRLPSSTPNFTGGFSMLPINGSSVITEWRRSFPPMMYAPCSSTPGPFGRLHRNTLGVTLAAGEAFIVEGFPRVCRIASRCGTIAPPRDGWLRCRGTSRQSAGLEAGPLAHHPGNHDRPKQATTMGPDLSIEVWRAKFVAVLSQHGTSERIRERPENF